jgi:hypothetical protein
MRSGLTHRMAEIFVCHRRQEGKMSVGRVCEALVQHLEADRISWDVDGIQRGDDFGRVIGTVNGRG